VSSRPDAAKSVLVQECTHRKVLHDDGRGRQRIEVDHKSGWRFMWHNGSFTTSLLVEEVGACALHSYACFGRPGVKQV
jgi:hypothetical protein